MRTLLSGNQENAARLGADNNFGEMMVDAFAWSLNPSVPLFWVDDDMANLVEMAAQVMPDEPPLPSDPPSLRGIAMFRTPVLRAPYFRENHPAIEKIQAIPWSGFCWSTFAKPDNMSNPVGIMLVGILDVAILRSMNKISEPWGGPPFIQLDGDTMFFDQPAVSALMPSDRGPEDVWRRQLPRAFWTIAKQRLANVTKAVLPRSLLRRIERDGTEIDDVRIVTLRRFDQSGREASDMEVDVEWSHRWIVSGHWRNQWLPSVKTHRLQWITPHIKGPDDKPLVVKETVGALVR